MSEYIGRRIVPVHGGVWSGSKSYEELTIVLDEDSGDSYISRRAVPAGTAITDEIYWMLHSLYSQQIADAVAQMEETETALAARVEEAEDLTNSNKSTLNSRMDSLETRLDANVSASTDADADYAAEVVDARIISDGTEKASLGAATREIEGRSLKEMKTTIGSSNAEDFGNTVDDLESNTVYNISITDSGLTTDEMKAILSGLPDDEYPTYGNIITINGNSSGVNKSQIFISNKNCWVRHYSYSAAEWKDWALASTTVSGDTSILSDGSDLNEILEDSTYTLNFNVYSYENAPCSRNGVLETVIYYGSNFRVGFQRYTTTIESGITGVTYTRTMTAGVWGAWDESDIRVPMSFSMTSAFSGDLDDYTTYGAHVVYTASNVENYPCSGAGFVLVMNSSISSVNVLFQIAISLSGDEVYYRYHNNSTGWHDWVSVGGSNNVRAECDCANDGSGDANVLIKDYFVSTCVDKSVVFLDEESQVICFGDSITAGSSTNGKWPTVLADRIGCTCYNHAVGGGIFGHSASARGEYYWISTQVSSVEDDEWENATLVIIAAGTNDVGYGIEPEETATYVQEVIDAVREKTSVPIVFITPIRRGTSKTASALLKLPATAGAICNTALRSECSVINGFDFPIATYDGEGIVSAADSNGLHPDSYGTWIYATGVINAIL